MSALLSSRRRYMYSVVLRHRPQNGLHLQEGACRRAEIGAGAEISMAAASSKRQARNVVRRRIDWRWRRRGLLLDRKSRDEHISLVCRQPNARRDRNIAARVNA